MSQLCVHEMPNRSCCILLRMYVIQTGSMTRDRRASMLVLISYTYSDAYTNIHTRIYIWKHTKIWTYRHILHSISYQYYCSISSGLRPGAWGSDSPMAGGSPNSLEFDASNLEKYRASTIYHHVSHIFQHVNKHAHSNKIQEPSHLHQPSTISTYTNHLNWRPPSGYRQSRGMNGSKRQLELVCVQVFRIIMVKTAESISNLTS